MNTSKRIFFVCLLLITINIVLFRQVKQITIYFNSDEISHEIINDFDYFSGNGFSRCEQLGEPDLPYSTVKVLVPDGARFIMLDQTIDTTIYRKNVKVFPIQPSVPTSKIGQKNFEWIEPDSNIYNSNNIFPRYASQYISTHLLSMYRYFSFRLSPLLYEPADGNLYLVKKIVLSIYYELDDYRDDLRWDDGIFRNILKKQIINSKDIENHNIYDSVLRSRENDIDYLIITSSDLIPNFEPLVYWKMQKGFSASIISLDTIMNNYPGLHPQLQIKNCIYDHYQNNSTQWILIGGDNTIIPDQDTYGKVGSDIDNTIPADLFYTCFDNQFDWNEDGDGKVGEPDDNVDLDPEVFISRAPVRSAIDADAFVNKSINYEKNPAQEDFAEEMITSGVELYNTWDNRSDIDWRSEGLWDNCIDPYWNGNHFRFYDTNTDFDGGSDYDVTDDHIVDVMNSGYGYFFMATHGTETTWNTEDGEFSSSYASFLLNNFNEQGLIVTVACLTNAFDFSYTDPCLSEAFIRNDSGGAIGYYGSSRYGWVNGNANSNHGPSFQYSDSLLKYIFNSYPDNYPYYLGAVATASKFSLASEATSNGAYRWLQFGINSIGDPAIDLFTEDPLPITANYPSMIYSFNTSINISNCNVSDALVILVNNDEIIGKTTLNNGSGTINFDSQQSCETIIITFSKHNYIPLIDEIEVAYDHDYTIENIIASPLNPVVGETVTISGTLKNIGNNSESSGQPVKLYIDGSFENGTTTTPSLDPDETTLVNLSWIAEDGAHNAKMQCFLTGDQNTSNDYKEIPIYVGTQGNLLIDGETNTTKNHTLDEGNYGNYTLQLQNDGSAAINGTISKGGSKSDWITLTDGTTFSIDPGDTETYNYKVTIPSGTSVGNYNANITFTYAEGSNIVSLNIHVVEYEDGYFEDQLLSGSVLIDGNNASTASLWHSFNGNTWFFLDNFPSTPWPLYVDKSETLSSSEYYRLNKAKWKLTVHENMPSSNSWFKISVEETSGHQYITDDINNMEYDIIEWINKGLNTFRDRLTNCSQTGQDAEWEIDQSTVFLYFSQSAWAEDSDIPQSELDKMENGWESGRLYFDVDNVYTSGELMLFNNGELIDTENISSSGDDEYFHLIFNDLSTSNYFNIKGDPGDDTKLTISNIRLIIEYHTGDPNLECTKSLSQNTAVLNQNVTVNLSFENIGSNEAEDPEYNDSPLPGGLTLVSGSLSGQTSDIDPGDTETENYIIKATEAGNYSFGGTDVIYENFGGDEFSSSFNAVSMLVNGGNLILDGNIDSTILEIGDTINISASVTGSILNETIDDAAVLCTVTDPYLDVYNSYLIYDESSEEYLGTFSNTNTLGTYTIDMTATRNFYNSDTLDPSIYFNIVKLEVLSPNDNEIWAQGSEHNIIWYDNIEGKVKIELYKGGILDHIICDSTESDGSYSWTIPASQQLDNDYKIKITSLNCSAIWDESDNNFSIVAPPSNVTVISPNGGEEWIQGTQYEITWSDNFADSVSIELYKGGIYNSTIIDTTASDSSYMWTIPSAQSPGNNYEVIICNVNDSQCCDDSDVGFSILEPVIVEVATDTSAYYPDETIEISITAINQTDDTITLEFGSCETTYFIDGEEYYNGINDFFCASMISYVDIPANDEYTWIHNHSLVSAPIDTGIHQLVGNVDNFGGPLISQPIQFEILEDPTNPFANFSTSDTIGNAPLSVIFSDLSTGSITSWQWDFDMDGIIDSYQQNPEWMYLIPGNYSVKLIVNNQNDQDSIIKTNYINVLPSYSSQDTSFLYGVIPSDSIVCFDAIDQLVLAGNNHSLLVSTGAEVDFIAGESIKMLPGFHAFNGSIVHAYISSTMCNPEFNCGDILVDSRDGKTYNTVLIGTQCWMAENLNIGVRINEVNNQSNNETIEKYCYNDIESNCDTFGGLYQWKEAMNWLFDEGTQGICPDGWHIPSENDWEILEGTVDSQYNYGDDEWDNIEYRGYDAGKNLKSITGWFNNGNGSDLYGFTGLPGGRKDRSGGFYSKEQQGAFWTSNSYTDYLAWLRQLFHSEDRIYRHRPFMINGFSVRCIKDNNEIESFQITNIKDYSQKMETIFVYPNPTTSYFNIVISSNKDVQNGILEIIDFTGRKLMQKVFLTNKRNEFDISSFENGLYIIKVCYGDNITVKKIIKL